MSNPINVAYAVAHVVGSGLNYFSLLRRVTANVCVGATTDALCVSTHESTWHLDGCVARDAIQRNVSSTAAFIAFARLVFIGCLLSFASSCVADTHRIRACIVARLNQESAHSEQCAAVVVVCQIGIYVPFESL